MRLESAEGRTTRLADLFQEGCLKVRLPYPQCECAADVVMINTAGGLTGGDRLSVEIDVREGGHATVTTPACERVYRSTGSDAVVEHFLRVDRRARLDWIPQETILFNRSRLRRRLDVELEADAVITIAEAVLLGRTAMGETVTDGFFSEFWTVRRGGDLLFADATRIAESFDRTTACATTLDSHAAMQPETARAARCYWSLRLASTALSVSVPSHAAVVCRASLFRTCRNWISVQVTTLREPLRWPDRRLRRVILG